MVKNKSVYNKGTAEICSREERENKKKHKSAEGRVRKTALMKQRGRSNLISSEILNFRSGQKLRKIMRYIIHSLYINKFIQSTELKR